MNNKSKNTNQNFSKMNIIITLPLRFINAIRKEEKRYEMRKSTPVKFDMQNDIVYVCEKGTGMVIGYFTVWGMTLTTVYNLANSTILEEICISTTELEEYAQNHPALMLYNIENFFDIKPRPISEFGIQTPPQSFAYTQVRQAVQ